nr:ribonuclease H-like domain-containing protein [Tanacetum cinerariifolium]
MFTGKQVNLCTQVSTASADVAAASISHDTVCAYITSQSNGSRIKYKDITQIDEDDIEEMDIKWNMALLSMRADTFWKKTGKKITIQVIEFSDSYKAPQEEAGKDPTSESSTKKKGRTMVITTEDMQKRRNDVKEAILKTFGGNEATKKTKKNQFKQQYGNFKAEDDLNQKFLTSLAPEWLMYTIVWRNRDDLDTMSLDDVYNHLKVYEPEVQKKLESNSQNMAFISSANTSSGKGEVHT